MLLWGFWVLAALPAPTSGSGQLAMGLAVIAALLVCAVAAAGWSLPVRSTPPTASGAIRRSRVRRLPRLADPDAAGRPRPRAPTAASAAVTAARV